MRTTAQIKQYKKKTQGRGTGRLLQDIRIVIESSKNGKANGSHKQWGKTMLYWQIGKRVRQALKKIQRAQRRRNLIDSLAEDLTAEFGKEYSSTKLQRMVEFGNRFSDSRAASLLAQKLNWRHFSILIPINDAMKRNFYAELCRMEGWSPRELSEQIKGMLYERASMSGHLSNGHARHVFKALRNEEGLPSEFIYDSPDVIDV